MTGRDPPADESSIQNTARPDQLSGLISCQADQAAFQWVSGPAKGSLCRGGSDVGTCLVGSTTLLGTWVPGYVCSTQLPVRTLPYLALPGPRYYVRYLPMPTWWYLHYCVEIWAFTAQMHGGA